MIWNPTAWLSEYPQIRSTLRRAGITQVVSALRQRSAQAYEQQVDRSLTAVIRPGDCVWDVGANIGLYTVRFADLVGPNGTIIAFEPILETYRVLETNTAHLANVLTRCEALGASQGSTVIALDSDPTSPSNSLAHLPSRPTDATQVVSIVSGDQLCNKHQLRIPSVLKIDTEGFEEDVLWGMRSMLRAPELRALMIEVHFAQLENRGYLRAPNRISSLLMDAGFHLEWIDSSHLLATKGA